MSPMTLHQLTIFPLKSFPGIDLPECRVLPSGALQGDRQFALVDAQGQFLNAKREPRIHTCPVVLGPQPWQIECGGQSWDLRSDQAAIAAWMSRWFQQPLTLAENGETGFPDDRVAPGPTVISTPTLVEVARWFEGLTLAECRRRFRANLEIHANQPFAEDHFFGLEGQPREFTVGSVRLFAINPCQRCAVPTRDTHTGAAIVGFQKQFALSRDRTLPAGVERSRFNHYYRLAINTRLAGPSGIVHVGDAITGP